ncbi:MAG: YidB family protein [Formosimonas sp.]
MGLIDGLLGAALGGNNGGVQGALLQAVIGMMAGGQQQQSGLGGLIGGLLGGGQQQSGGLGGLLGGLLGGGQQQASTQVAGGLGNLTGMLSQLGLGKQVESWIGTGENESISADDIQNTLGSNGTLSELAKSAGVSETEAAGGLAQLLPELVNKLTPNGKVDANDIGSVLSSLLGNK